MPSSDDIENGNCVTTTICNMTYHHPSRSDKLWEAYINWESTGKRWKNVTLLYERLLATPTSRYVQHWQRFQEHVRKHMPSEVIGVEEFLTIRREVLAELNRSDIETPDEAPPGVETAPGDDQLGTNVVRHTQGEEEEEMQLKFRDKLRLLVSFWLYNDRMDWNFTIYRKVFCSTLLFSFPNFLLIVLWHPSVLSTFLKFTERYRPVLANC